MNLIFALNDATLCKLIIFAKTTIRGLNTKSYLPGKLSPDLYRHVLPNQSYSTWLSTCKITLVFDAWVLFQHNQSECVHSLVTVTIVTISSIITNAWDVQPFCLGPLLSFMMHCDEVVPTSDVSLTWSDRSRSTTLLFTSDKCWLKGVHSLYLLIECVIACVFYQHKIVKRVVVGKF